MQPGHIPMMACRAAAEPASDLQSSARTAIVIESKLPIMACVFAPFAARGAWKLMHKKAPPFKGFDRRTVTYMSGCKPEVVIEPFVTPCTLGRTIIQPSQPRVGLRGANTFRYTESQTEWCICVDRLCWTVSETGRGLDFVLRGSAEKYELAACMCLTRSPERSLLGRAIAEAP